MPSRQGPQCLEMALGGLFLVYGLSLRYTGFPQPVLLSGEQVLSFLNRGP